MGSAIPLAAVAIFYLAERIEIDVGMLAFSGSWVFCAIAYLLGALLEQSRLRHRIVLSFAFLFLSMWFMLPPLSFFLSLILVPTTESMEPKWIFAIVFSAVFWIPLYLQEAYNLLRAYEGKTV